MSTSPSQPTINDLIRHSAWLKRLARTLVSDPALADDLVQETWVSALENPPRHHGNIKGWLSRILRNRAATHFRSGVRRLTREQRRGEAVEPNELRTAESVVERGELSQLLANSIMDLDEPFRTTLLMRFHEDMSTAEIAEQMNVPDSTVRTRLNRGLRKLRAIVQQRLGKSWKDCHSQLAAFAGIGSQAGLSQSKLAILATVFVSLALTSLWINHDDSQVRPIEVEASLPTGGVQNSPGLQVDSPPLKRTEQRVESSPLKTADFKSTSIGTIAFTGRVIDEDGSPLKGATVQFKAQNPFAGDSTEWENPDAILTAADGLFELEFAPPPAHYSKKLTITAPARVPRVADWKLRGDTLRSREIGDIVLRKGTVLFGKVVCNDGDLPKRLVVSVKGLRGCEIFPDTRVEHRFYTFTDEDGRFRMTDGVPPGTTALGFSQPGFEVLSDLKAEVPKEGAEHYVEVQVKERPFLSGRVQYADGTVPGRVFLKGITPVKRSGKFSGVWTRPDGTFRLHARENNENDSGLSIAILDLAKIGVLETTTEAVYNWGDQNVVIQLEPTLHADIRVVDNLTGQPIEDFGAFITNEPHYRFLESASPKWNGNHKGGILRLNKLAEGSHFLRVFPADDKYATSDWIEVLATRHSLDPHVIRLESMNMVPVTLTTEQGNPVANSTVRLLEDGLPQPRVLFTAVTNDQGKCEIGWPRSLNSAIIRATGDHETMEIKVEKSISQRNGIEIKVAEEFILSGSIAWGFESVGNMHLYFEGFNDGTVISPLPEHLLIRPDENGNFRVKLDPDSYRVHLMYPNKYASEQSLEFDEGHWFQMEPPLAELVIGNGPILDLALDANHFTPARLSGHVTLDGTPAANFQLQLVHRSNSKPNNQSTTLGGIFTDEYGNFEVDNLMPGWVEVSLLAPERDISWTGFAPCKSPAIVLPGEHTVATFTAVSRQLKLRPLHPDTEKPMPNKSWHALSIGLLNLTSDDDGWILISPAPAKKFRLISSGKGEPLLQTDYLQVDASQHTTVIECPTYKKGNGFR